MSRCQLRQDSKRMPGYDKKRAACCMSRCATAAGPRFNRRTRPAGNRDSSRWRPIPSLSLTVQGSSRARAAPPPDSSRLSFHCDPFFGTSAATRLETTHLKEPIGKRTAAASTRYETTRIRQTLMSAHPVLETTGDKTADHAKGRTANSGSLLAVQQHVKGQMEHRDGNRSRCARNPFAWLEGLNSVNWIESCRAASLHNCDHQRWRQ